MMKNRLGSNTELRWCCVPTISTDTDLILPIQVFYKIIAVARKPSRFVPHMSSIIFFSSPAAQSQDSGATERCNSTRQLLQKPDQGSLGL